MKLRVKSNLLSVLGHVWTEGEIVDLENFELSQDILEQLLEQDLVEIVEIEEENTGSGEDNEH